MNGFQLIGLAIIGILVAWSVNSIVTERSRLASSFVWLLIWASAGYALMYPDSLTKAARFLGIDRGADLLSYLTTLALIIGFFLIYRSYRSIQSQMTLLVREIAFLKAESGAFGTGNKCSIQPESISPKSPNRDYQK